MSASGELSYTVRALSPDTLQWARDNTVQVTIWRDGAQVVPSAATFQLIKPDGLDAVATTAATISAAGTVSYVVTAATLPTTDTSILGQGWRQVWVLTLPDGTIRSIDRMMDVARFPLNCPITDADLLVLYPHLAAHKGTSPTSFQGFIDEAWRRARAAFRAAGKLEYLFRNPEAMREALMHSALAMAFRSMAMGSGQRGNYQELADYHAGQAPASWSEVALAVDWDHDGAVDDLEERTSSGSIIGIGGAPFRTRRRTRWSF